MNASASVLTREGEVQSKIGKIRTFSRGARVVCSALFGFGIVGSVGMLLLIALGSFVPKIASVSSFTADQRLWVFSVMLLIGSAWLAAVYQLYRLFGNLAAGAIHTSENVRRVRNVGFLWLMLAVLGVLIPIGTAVLTSMGFSVPAGGAAFSVSDSLSSFAAAGLILLVSWIMDVGLYEKDHADALQRDADLVI